MKDKKLPLCIKLDRETREKFKRITHDRQTTMQSVLKAFVAFYIVNPDSISVQNNSSMTIASTDSEAQNGSI